MLEIADDNNCFVCGELNSKGLQVRLTQDNATRSASCRTTLAKPFQGWNNLVHGGILATLLDETSAYAAKTLATHVVTAELSVRYHKPVPIDKEIVVEAIVVDQRKKIVTVAAKLMLDGVVHAESDAKLFILS